MEPSDDTAAPATAPSAGNALHAVLESEVRLRGQREAARSRAGEILREAEAAAARAEARLERARGRLTLLETSMVRKDAERELGRIRQAGAAGLARWSPTAERLEALAASVAERLLDDLFGPEIPAATGTADATRERVP